MIPARRPNSSSSLLYAMYYGNDEKFAPPDKSYLLFCPTFANVKKRITRNKKNVRLVFRSKKKAR